VESVATRGTHAVLSVIVCALALVALAAPVANAAPASAALPAPTAGGTLTYQLNSKPAGIDPRFASFWDAAVVSAALFDGLTRLDGRTSAVLPAVASSWDAGADATVWTFHLRPDASFSNGTRVTAQDFKSAWERLFTSASKGWAGALLHNVKGAAALAAGKAKHLSGVVAQDPATLVVTLTAPYADFPSVVADPCLAPLPRGLLSTARKAAQFRAAPVGNGPFMLAQPWDRRNTVRLVPAPGYYGTKPYIAGITFTAVTDPVTAYARFQGGLYDVAGFPVASLAEVEAAYGTSADGFAANPGQQVVPGPTAGILYCAFNTKKAPLDDVRVRRAFSLALDRTKLATSVPPPTMLLSPATDMLSPGVPGYVPGQWLYAKLDQAQAAALLTEAGFPGGAGLPEITFLTTEGADYSGYKTDLEAIGVKVRLVNVSQARWAARWDTGTYMMTQMWTSFVSLSPGVLYDLFYGPLDASGSFYDDAAVNASLRQACETLDDTARVAAFQSIDATIAADAPVTPIAYWPRAVVCSARLHEAVLSPMNLFDFTRVWIE
jgi:ABC-type transport system substrate-binding protein